MMGQNHCKPLILYATNLEIAVRLLSELSPMLDSLLRKYRGGNLVFSGYGQLQRTPVFSSSGPGDLQPKL